MVPVSMLQVNDDAQTPFFYGKFHQLLFEKMYAFFFLISRPQILSVKTFYNGSNFGRDLVERKEISRKICKGFWNEGEPTSFRNMMRVVPFLELSLFLL